MFTPEFLLNWMLQGAAVAAATALGLQLAGRLRADIRYRVCWLALALVLALPAMPNVLSLATSPGTPVPVSSAQELVHDTAARSQGATSAAPLLAVPDTFRSGMTVAGAVWALWIIVHAGVLALDLHRLRRARQRCRPLSAETRARIAPGTARRLETAGARLAYSEEIRAAAVLGWGTPIVALQPSLTAQLTDGELDQMIVHEWAHVTRGDWRATLLQHVVHALVGWQPAVWWLGRRLGLERELACDEVAMSAGGSARGYATCLTRLATLTHTPHTRTLAVGALAASGLRRRVLYALAIEQHGTPWTKGLAALALPAIVVASTIGVSARPVVGVHVPATRSTAPLATAVASAGMAAPARGTSPITPATRSVAMPATVAPVPAQHVIESTAAASEIVPALAETIAPVDAPLIQAVSVQTAPIQIAVVQIPTVQLEPAPLPTTEAPQAPTPAQQATTPPATLDAVAVWNATSGAAADTAVTISRGSRNGAVATAGFFTRFGKRVATTVASQATNRSN